MTAESAVDRGIARAFAQVGVERDDTLDPRFAAVRRFLLLSVAVESWNALRYSAYQDDLAVHTVIAAIQLICLGAGWVGPGTRAATVVSALGLALGMTLAFPFNANHQAVQILCLAAVALVRPEAGAPADTADSRNAAVPKRDVLLAMRWVAVVILFWAGAQKLLWGMYTGGEFLAQRISIDPGFAQFFGLIIPDAELARLVGLQAADGAGPYRVDSWLFVVVSNLSWMAEIAIAGALLHPRLRALAWPAGIFFILCVELAAREIFFGTLLAFLLLLFQEGRWAPRSLWVFGPAAAYLFTMAVGWMPHWSFG